MVKLTLTAPKPPNPSPLSQMSAPNDPQVGSSTGASRALQPPAGARQAVPMGLQPWGPQSAAAAATTTTSAATPAAASASNSTPAAPARQAPIWQQPLVAAHPQPVLASATEGTNRPQILPPPSTLVDARQDVQAPTLQGYEPCLIQLLDFYIRKPDSFLTLAVLYFQNSDDPPQSVATRARTPGEIARYRKLGQSWSRNYRQLDLREKDPTAHMECKVDANDREAQAIINDVAVNRDASRDSFEEALRQWASNARNDAAVSAVLQAAGWTQENMWLSKEYETMHNLLKLPESDEKRSILEQAREESPRFYDACMEDHKSRKIVSNDGQVTWQYRKRDLVEFQEPTEPAEESPSKRPRMDASFGRPTQVHGVPLEERAFDSKGNRLPWGLEWHPDHPNARGQKRHVEEKGPFGKSNRRKGSSRTRTATPAKKENPAIDGFEKAMQYTKSQNPNAQLDTQGSRIQSEGNLASQRAISANKQPTQVYIFGYATDSQWDALDKYEKASHGMVCEDYARDPPLSAKRYPSTFSSSRAKRSLTPAEKTMSMRYDGGEHWVKVTFDSAEAAERAIECSPMLSYGCWVYAQYYHGKGPERDEPIPLQEGDSPRRPRQRPQTMGATHASRTDSQSNAGITLPRSFAPSAPIESQESSPSSSTETSGTATGIQYPDLHHRNIAPSFNSTGLTGQQQPLNPQMMKHFPDMPRTILRPASEALLPQPTWWERQLQWLRASGLLPQEVIGNGIPMTEDGKPDMSQASFYWRFFYFIDTKFGTDYCGLRDEE
ncbi:uncharacterized protein KY384_006405 [Bacidia gigantensis]|uniref:uncharacterized protein n=1 Tax=Bacidia gigantensis TaxID=2732470 RepID=UPI001D03EBEE|nr:uncharacterized protein KY384_006405 [Bacidia gigantensis]KAG8528718.1 hypothetical protein KY384_006405 [Bacidia gigantensis]